MRLAIFGLTVTSSFGNGHATLWRGLLRALAAQGHRAVFFERDVPYYAAHRDAAELPGTEVVLYPRWDEVASRAARAVAEADAAIVTSYCADAAAAARLVCDRAKLPVFYDMDSPVTLARLAGGLDVPYLPYEGHLGAFGLVLSYAGGPVLRELETRLKARRTAALYGHVDPEAHRPAPREARYAADCAYLGTYAPDRQQALNALLLAAARRRPDATFRVGGSLYPDDVAWPVNVRRDAHVAPADHPAFFCSARLSLNLTRGDMKRSGWCPSGRLFEAAACGAAQITDAWDGLDAFFAPEEEILVARTADDVLAALDRSHADLARIAAAARARVLERHTASARARELVAHLDAALRPALAAV